MCLAFTDIWVMNNTPPPPPPPVFALRPVPGLSYAWSRGRVQEYEIYIEFDRGKAQYPATPYASDFEIPYPLDWNSIVSATENNAIVFTIPNQPAKDHRPPSVQFDYPNPNIHGEFNVDFWFADTYFKARGTDTSNV